jgi:hypothetical protein
MLTDSQFQKTSSNDKYGDSFAFKLFGVPEMQRECVKEGVATLTTQYFYDNSLSSPLIFGNNAEMLSLLKIKLPVVTTLENIADIIGHDFPVKVPNYSY